MLGALKTLIEFKSFFSYWSSLEQEFGQGESKYSNIRGKQEGILI